VVVEQGAKAGRGDADDAEGIQWMKRRVEPSKWARMRAWMAFWSWPGAKSRVVSVPQPHAQARSRYCSSSGSSM
jgi:hypothetical protein